MQKPMTMPVVKKAPQMKKSAPIGTTQKAMTGAVNNTMKKGTLGVGFGGK